MNLGPFAIRDGKRDIVGNASQFLFSQNYSSYTGMNPNKDWVLDPSWHARSRMDATPPAVFANRLGHYFLPGCASFKVEWTVDDPRLVGEPNVYWFDPHDSGDPSDPADKLGELQNVIDDPNTDPIRAARLQLLRNELALRFGTLGELDATGTVFPTLVPGRPVWVDVDPTNVNPASPTSGAADPFFPKALRITVDLVDSQSRFDRPLRHVMILPVGRS